MPYVYCNFIRFFTDVTKDYLDQKMVELTALFKSGMTGMKRSLLYDSEQKTQELKNTMIMNNKLNNTTMNLFKAKANLEIELPIRTLETFLEFEEKLEAEDKKRAW